MISRKFIKSSLIYTVAGSLPMASAIILLPFYINFLPSSVYGALSLYLAFSLIVQIVVTYSFDSSLYIHYHEFKSTPEKLSVFISTAFIFMIGIGIVVGIILVVTGNWVFAFVFKDQKISFFPYGIMSVLVGIFQAMFKVYSNLMQSRERPEQFFWTNVLLLTCIAGFTIFGLYSFPSSLMGPIGSRVIAGSVATVWILYRVFKEFGIHFNFDLIRSTFSYNNYTFLYQIQQWVINNFDRFVMVLFLPLADVGIYDFSIKCLVVIEYLMNGLHNSFLPKVVSTVMEQKEKGSTVEMNRYYYGLIGVVMIVVSLGIFTLPFVIELLDGKPEYKTAVQYLPYIAVIHILKSIRMYFGVSYVILKNTKPLAVIYLIVSLIKILVMVILIPYLGIVGVVMASAMAAGFEIILLKRGLINKFSFRYNPYKLWVMPFTLLLSIFLLEPMVGNNWDTLLHGFYIFLAGMFLFWMYRNELSSLSLSKLFQKK